MSKIMELRSKRNTLWEQTKDFLEKHRGENGLVEASAVEQYNKMASEVQALGTEIERLEQQAAFDAALSAPTSKPVTNAPGGQKNPEITPTATAEYSSAFWNMIRNKGDQFAVHNALSVGEDTEGGFTVPSEFERRLVQSLEENNIFRQMATVIKTNSGTRKIPIATDTMEAQWIDEGEEIPETDTRFGQTTLSAYKLGTMIKISNELLHDSAFDLASYIATRFGVAMGNAEERAFFTGDGDKKPLGILAETGGAEIGVTSASQTAITFDEIFDLYYSLKSPYRRNAQFVCNETILLQLMKLKDKNDQYLWKPSLDTKNYLRVDHCEDDKLILTLIDTAQRLVMDVGRMNENQLAEHEETTRQAMLYTVSYLYENRNTADYHALTLTLRSLLFAQREGVV